MKKLIFLFKKLSINMKVFLTYLAFVAVIGGGASLLMALNEKLVVQQGHVSLAQNISENVSPMLAIQHRMMLNRVVNIVDRLAGVRDCAIVNQEGLVLAHTDPSMMDESIDIGNAAHKAFAQKGYLFFTNPLSRTDEVKAPVFDSGIYLGSVLLSFDRTDLVSLILTPREGTLRILRNVIFFVALFGLIGAVVISRLISYPVRVLREKIFAVLQGKFPVKKPFNHSVFCWEEMDCRQTKCPCYNNKDEKCWTVAGTFCKGVVHGKKARELGDCLICPVYKKNSGDELEQVNDGFDIMVGELLDNAENMRRAKEDIESANAQNMEMRIYHERILDSLSSAVISLDENLIIRKYNQAAQAILGVDLAELVGNNITEVQKECSRCADFFGVILDAIRRYQEDGRPVVGQEVSVQRINGGIITLNLSLLPLLGSIMEKGPIIVTFEDITEREKMRVELNQAQNLAELGEVAAKVAHDVRNPLSAIEGSVHYVISKYEADPEIRHMANLIQGQVERLNNVMQDLLKISRPMVAKCRPCDFNLLVEESLSFLDEEIAKNDLVLEKKFDELPQVILDPNQFQRVIINLMENAIEATPAQGAIALRTRMLSNNAAEEWVEFSITDTGGGIPDAISDQIFKPFYTTKTNGTGLGLAIVKQIVAQHKGSIEARKLNGQPGAELIVHIPLKMALYNEGECYV